MNNKETLKIYNNRLNNNTTSLNNILETINTLPEKEEIILQDKEITPTKKTQTVSADEGYDGLNNVTVNPIPDEYIVANLQDKSITLTENGTQTVIADEGYDGLNSVKVVANVGGSISNKNIIEEFYDAYSKFYDALTPEYNKTYDTNESVTLYTPVDGYTNYFILLNAKGKYQIMWSPSSRSVGYMGSNNRFYPIAVFYIAQTSLYSGGTKQNKLGSYMDLLSINTSNSGISFYASSAYDTVEECFEAIKNNTTVYTKNSTTYLVGSKYNNTNTCVIMTNSLEIGTTELINECGRQLSSNETIVVQTTE